MTEAERNHFMKRCVWLLLLLCMLFSSAQALETMQASDGSIRFEGKSSRLFYQPVLALSNGNLLMAVNHSETGGAYQTWVICLAPDGQQLWAADISRNGQSMFVSAMREAADGVIHVTASLHRYKDRQQLGLSMADGTILWQTEPVQIFSDEVAADENVLIQSVPVGDYFLSSETYDYAASCEPVYLQLETHDGSVLWRAKDAPVGMSTVKSDQAWAIEQDVLLFGRCAEGAVLQRMDARANAVWRTVLPEPVGAEQLIVTQNGQILLFSISSSQGMDSENMRWDQRHFACLSGENGEMLWVRHHAVPEEQLARIHGMLEIPQGYLCITSTANRTGLSCFLMDHQGNAQREWTFSPLAPCETPLDAALFLWQNQPWACIAFDTADGFLDVALFPFEMAE